MTKDLCIGHSLRSITGSSNIDLPTPEANDAIDCQEMTWAYKRILRPIQLSIVAHNCDDVLGTRRHKKLHSLYFLLPTAIPTKKRWNWNKFGQTIRISCICYWYRNIFKLWLCDKFNASFLIIGLHKFYGKLTNLVLYSYMKRLISVSFVHWVIITQSNWMIHVCPIVYKYIK